LRSVRRLLRRKEREQARQFLAEGRQAVAEALTAGAVAEIVVADGVVDRHADLLDRASRAGVRVGVASSDEVAALTDTVTPQGIVAVCRYVDVALETALGAAPRLVVLGDRVRDPGNLGAVVRCADAFGADAVLVTRESVDLYNPKTVRASTGSLFHLPVAVAVDPTAAVAQARAAGLTVLGADGSAPETTEDLSRAGLLARPVLWVLGNEAWGLPPEQVAYLDRRVSLPMYGRAESLNLATAAAVLLYATATAQRAVSERQTQVSRPASRS
jgi:TrmH family RNA methyltransferase